MSHADDPKSAHIEIVANDADIKSDGSAWKPIWRHDTELGHDKALSINEYRASAKLEAEDGSIPLIVFIGDGVSDLPAAREADVLFARRGLRLEEYCIENKIAYIGFDTFADIQKEVEKIVQEDQEKTGGVGKPARFNPRANLWRRVSSKQSVSYTMLHTYRAWRELSLISFAGSVVCGCYTIQGRSHVPLAKPVLSAETSGDHRGCLCLMGCYCMIYLLFSAA